ncbi:MSHA biogenesis protein MshP [Simiduia sp. 21SJ11W-1]|uniref:MSHA biogenesis protein MshP n=1 Tax=Simiduia sp. 21SJ11W-1 TaxID=2909669 RepID=UPI00209F6EDF|nr:MSHA biogenesis protein MshP [Simiduia sp. 21SJ11W-1]UTA46577.1 MSHA biogenesis protein MshP [Simiduia sp. 21SJ11W-1]
MPLAIFIVIAMGVLAIAVSRNIAQSSNSTLQAMVAIQAFYAADSGAQFGMNQLFYSQSAQLTRTQVDANCNAINGQLVSYSAQGLNNCSASLSCSVSAGPANVTSYYTLSSDASCGDGVINSQRSVQVSAFMR